MIKALDIEKLYDLQLTWSKAKLSDEERFDLLFKLMVQIIDHHIEQEDLYFATLYSKMAYLGNTYNLPSKLMYHIHSLRIKLENENSITEDDVSCAYFCINGLLENLCETKPLDSIKHLYSDWETNFVVEDLDVDFSSLVYANVIAFDEKSDGFKIQDRDRPARYRLLKIPSDNTFDRTYQYLKTAHSLPIQVVLHNVEIEDGQYYKADKIVLEADYLVDVTSIAELFQVHGVYSRLSMLKKFLPIESSQYLVLGNLANNFLDELIHNPELKFSELKENIFASQPLSLSMFNNEIVRKLLRQSEEHFNNLKRVISSDYFRKNIQTENCYLEPSFYSAEYGLQGRLDLFHSNLQEGKLNIIELKSGKVYRPNVYGLNSNHFTQTLLYDLLVKSTFKERYKASNFILYSSQKEKALRFAPSVKKQQNDALQARNELIMLELLLADQNKNHLIFESLNPKNFQDLSGFVLEDLKRFNNVYSKLKSIEKKYFHTFCAFICREQIRAKLGSIDSERLNGLSSIWVNTLSEKKEKFSILNHLEILSNDTTSNPPTLILKRSERTFDLSKFRVGDISVLYPYNSKRKSALRNQVFKCTILELGPELIKLRLRSKQYNDQLFQNNKYWNIEHDVLDKGFVAMYRNLFSFVATKEDRKNLVFGLQPPRKPIKGLVEDQEEMTDEQNKIFKQIILSQDYFLLWGPPGTGKTSVMLKNIVKYFYQETPENLLVLAYTNRAVDEICSALCSISEDFKNNIVRIGSRYSTHIDYRDRLFENLIIDIKSRSGIRNFIKDKRIFVATLASFQSKEELFQLKSFDRMIVDEASQILEPNLVALMARVKNSVLIGDHKQLPAVVIQEDHLTEVTDQELLKIGVINLKNSLFERLYRHCITNRWDWAVGQITAQGRMHEELMSFPNEQFYNGKLTVLSKLSRLKSPRTMNSMDESLKWLVENRTLYIPTGLDDRGQVNKTNDQEAQIIVKLCQWVTDLYRRNGLEVQSDSIGIISPFRAQIALIKSFFTEAKMDVSKISIDTVERYQGGARDIVIISCCVNSESQLSAIQSISSEGIDRKLNVALTRAREQIIILGNYAMLSKSKIYKSLLDSYHKRELNLSDS